MSKNKIDLIQQKLERVLIALKEMIDKPMQDDRSNIDACIQRFEFSIELFWKFLKRILEDRGLELIYPKDVIRAAYQGKLIDQEDIWLDMLKDRNMASHTYDEELADEIYTHITTYYQLLWSSFQKNKNNSVRQQ